LGEAAVKFSSLGQEKNIALLLTYQGRQLLILPPIRHWETQDGAGLPERVEVLIIPVTLPDSAQEALATRFKPAQVVIYGSPRRPLLEARASGAGVSLHFTRNGAVSVHLSSTGVTVRQRP
jgi:hypothetical protein